MTPAISDRTLLRNVSNTLEDTSVQLVHAQDVRGRARTGYYKAMILLLASVAEALVHHLIEKACNQDSSLAGQKPVINKKLLVQVNNSALQSPLDLWVAEREEQPFSLNGVGFQAMNVFCLETNLINRRLYNALEQIREKRNEIHLQSLSTSSRSFTLRMVGSASSAIVDLLDKLNNYGST